MRIMDAMMSFPAIFLAIGMAAILGRQAQCGDRPLDGLHSEDSTRRPLVGLSKKVIYIGSGVARASHRVFFAMSCNSLSPLIVQVTFVLLMQSSRRRR